jgi:hypothetical protein
MSDETDFDAETDMVEVTPVASFALFRNEPGAYLVCYKAHPEHDTAAPALALLLADTEEGGDEAALLVETGDELLLLGDIPSAMAEGMAEAGRASVLCYTSSGECLSLDVPVNGGEAEGDEPPALVEDPETVGAFVSGFMEFGAQSLVSAGAELVPN